MSDIPRHITTSLPKALTAIRAVLELHKPVHTPSGQLCSTCAEESDCAYALPWPCPTVQAVQTAIEGGR